MVEGLTEFLPVSSTGHLILTSHFLGVAESEVSKAFDVIIQGGAILAVLWHYRVPLWGRVLSFVQGRREGRELALSLFAAFLPAALLGLFFAKTIKTHLFGVQPVAWALLVGGVLMLAAEAWLPKVTALRGPEHDGLAKVSRGQAIAIGLCQCFALWPGVSRSMATILGGRLAGLDARSSAEFSFLLAIPTLLAATFYDFFKIRRELDVSTHGPALLVGSFVSFVVALIVIRAFLKFLQSHSLAVFGWYRIAVGVALLVLFRSAG